MPFNHCLSKLNVALSIAMVMGVFALAGCAGSPKTTGPHTDMVEVPAGAFMMGMEIENDHHWGDTDEEQVHEVYLDTFWIDRYEVTAADFAEFLNHHSDQSKTYLETGNAVTVEYVDGRYRARSGLERWPVNRVSWYGADAFCRDQGKRLPTEAEWEKAAKGTDARPFPWGSAYPNNDLATFRRPFSRYGFDAMKPVDSMPAGRSPYGVHHMAGNVWEWVSDWYDPAYYDDSPRENPQGPEKTISKVLRGGNWYFKAYYMRTTYRFNEHPHAFKVWQGFRCASSPEGQD